MGDDVTPRSRDIQGIIEIVGIMENTADKMSEKMHLIADVNRSVCIHKCANDSDAACCCCCVVQRLFPILLGHENIRDNNCGLNHGPDLGEWAYKRDSSINAQCESTMVRVLDACEPFLAHGLNTPFQTKPPKRAASPRGFFPAPDDTLGSQLHSMCTVQLAL